MKSEKFSNITPIYSPLILSEVNSDFRFTRHECPYSVAIVQNRSAFRWLFNLNFDMNNLLINLSNQRLLSPLFLNYVGENVGDDSTGNAEKFDHEQYVRGGHQEDGDKT